jgi:hypothetical protein
MTNGVGFHLVGEEETNVKLRVFCMYPTHRHICANVAPSVEFRLEKVASISGIQPFLFA